MSPPAIRDHVALADTDHPPGIYRVVGRDEGQVTLLRVGDEDGTRVSGGEVVTVSEADFDRSAPAENPDGNRPLPTAIATQAGMVYWSLRAFTGQLLGNPVAASVPLALLLAGGFGEEFVAGPDFLFGGLILVGALGLAFVGSGRL